MKRMFVLFLGLITFVTFTPPALAEGNLGFSQTQYNYDLKVGQTLDVDLKTLLKEIPDGDLQWSAGSNKPAWVTIDSTNSTLNATPDKNAVGQHSFRLSVKLGEQGALAQINLNVIALPAWTESPLDLGLQKEGTAYAEVRCKDKTMRPNMSYIRLNPAFKSASG